MLLLFNVVIGIITIIIIFNTQIVIKNTRFFHIFERFN